MIFNVHTFKEPLVNYMESMFHFKGFMPDHSIERVVPTGHVFVIFELDGMVRNTFDNNTLKPIANFEKVWISGVHENYISISAHPNSEMFVFQFKPFGALPFLHQQVADLSNRVIPAQEIFGDEIILLHKTIKEANTSEEKFNIGETWLKSRIDNDLLPPKALIDFLSELHKQPVVNYTELNSSYPHTQKHLIDQFKKYIGLTPKYYQRMLRFNEILKKIEQKQKVNWPDVALLCRYSDQSHFIKEFHHFSGFNPTEYIKQEFQHEEPNFFPVDR